jgi:hypothetical protein
MVRPSHFKLTVEQILRHSQSVDGTCCAAELMSLLADNACRFHHAGDPLVSDLLPSPLAKLSVNPRTAVRQSAFLVHFLGLNRQLLARALPSRKSSLLEHIDATSGHFQNSAEPGLWIVGLLRTDEQEPHSLSFAKKAVAFLGRRALSAVACSPG